MAIERIRELALLMVFILLTVTYYFMDVHPLTENTQVKMYIAFLMAGVLLFSIMQILRLLRISNKEKKEQVEMKDEVVTEEVKPEEISNAEKKKNLILFTTITLLYFVLVNTVGFYVVTGMYIGMTMFVLGIRGKFSFVSVPVVYCIVIFFVFEFLLNVGFPRGWLF
ncbi:tripartite tricarboxylate transporter TctB family protein [Salisediminibacterium beveridgei]|uniref:DUF1468 domain-containing protein n=1 Tax=Salisediminibacterium beveridgei TaxID=632773 RepID=A0A1D7QS60_9BACI|nr:tripartite tricarboxylate transporter TctB family protein [Salisediminibacterium beveridgei]AOM81845.1 hypothetical protein BBEV_0451 [Salisediminibacterium beveridgei]